MMLLGIVVVALIVLTGCVNDGHVHRERIDGHNCLVRRDRINNHVEAMSCDWKK